MKTSKMSTKLAVSVAIVAAGALLLAGCSSDMEDTSALATASEVAESEPSIEPAAPADAAEDTSALATASEVAESEPSIEPAAPADPAVADPAAVATPLPLFSSTTLQGKSVTQADYEGKPTIMWFWAPWCSVCRGEAPTLSKVAGKLKGSVDVVGVAALGSVDEMKTFVSDTGIKNFTQLADPDAQVWSVFGVASQPAFAFISADGSIDVVQGSIDENEILERAAALS